jgi:hypothetical protein
VRPALTLTLAIGLLTLSACASQSHVTAPRPPIPRAVATSLAGASDALAAALRRGDGCAAKVEMHGLERQTRIAVAAGRVPAPYQARLLAAERQLAGRVPRCVPPPPPPPPPPAPNPSEQDKKHGDHPKPKRHDKEGGD